ncbi:nuclear transport factor 2 family protein [Microbacterium sp. 22303]|uniref:nuclear transport factor 2 family protein n=1 Tax=Microbacterium sp. 22303 TaxID=3453905 RepID=UPI003F8259BC
MWHRDGTVAYGPDIVAGSAHDFVAWTNRLHLQFRFTSQQAMNVVVRIDTDAAVSEPQDHILLVEPLIGEASTIRHAYGRYLDRWSRRDGVWAIDHRQYRPRLRLHRAARGHHQ